MQLFFRPLARADVLLQYEYYLDSGLDVIAERWLASVETSASGLLHFPRKGAPVPMDAHELKSLRVWPVSDFPAFRLFYLESQNTIDVLRVLHAKCDVASLLAQSV